MDHKPVGPLSQMFYVLADQLRTRLTLIGCAVKVENDPMMLSYRATVTMPQGQTGEGLDWSPVAAIEKAYQAACQQADMERVVQV